MVRPKPARPSGAGLAILGRGRSFEFAIGRALLLMVLRMVVAELRTHRTLFPFIARYVFGLVVLDS